VPLWSIDQLKRQLTTSMTTASGVLAEKTKPKFLAPFTNAPSSEINDKSQ